MLTDVEKEVYSLLKDKLNITEEEFALLSSFEKNDWVESCKLAKLLYENKYNEFYDGYKDTDIGDKNSFHFVNEGLKNINSNNVIDIENTE